MTTPRPRLPGPFQQLVLLALARLGSDCYGMAIHRFIEARTGRRTSVGAVYKTLARMERRGWVHSWKRPAVGPTILPDRIVLDGPAPRTARRFWSMATLGRRAVRRACQALDRMRAGLPGFGSADRRFRWREPSRAPGRPASRRGGHREQRAAGGPEGALTEARAEALWALMRRRRERTGVRWLEIAGWHRPRCRSHLA